MLDVNWQMSYSLTIPKNWLSGNYLARLTGRTGQHGYIYFVVRNDNRPSAILAVMPVNSYEAYNLWGGKNIYDRTSLGPDTVGPNQTRAVKVSFNRPYSTELIDFRIYRDNDLGLVQFLERNGYDVTYATSLDLDRNPALMQQHRLYLSVGHDEYWSRQMRLNLEAARDMGTNLAFLGGNDVFIQVRYEPDHAGRPARTLVCFKSLLLDPLHATDRPNVTIGFTSLGWAQNSLTGTVYDGGAVPRYANWTVTSGAPQWLLAGTGLAPGNQISNLVRTECDRITTHSPQPPTLQVVGSSTFINTGGQPTTCDSVWYVTKHRSEVFSAGDEGWQYMIDDRRVARLTTNLLDHLDRWYPPAEPR
jgi:hypothetical protein